MTSEKRCLIIIRYFARPTLPFVYLQIITPSMSIFKFKVAYSAKGQGRCHLWQRLVMRWTRSLGNVDLEKSQWGAKRFGGTLRKAMRGEERYHRGWLRCVLTSIHWLLTVSARPRVEVRKCLDFFHRQAENVTCYSDIGRERNFLLHNSKAAKLTSIPIS